MRIAVTGSIATDHLMSFPGRIADQLIADQLEQVSLSFLVDELEVRRGGIAANITFGLGKLGVTPYLVGAVGEDFDEYRSWLERHGVDTASVHVSATKHTSRFLCTTDQDFNQIASFYPGAMSEAREIELKSVADRIGGLDLVVISANDPDAMIRHTQESRERGYKFLADPGQQLARMDGEAVRKLVEGAEYLFTNEYEHGLLLESTGWSHEEVLGKVGSWVTSLGAKGLKVESASAPTLEVVPPKEKQKGDPTGVGDALRAGFLAGLSGGLGLERSLQLGCTLATVSLETDGPQEYDVERESFLARIAEAYGESAATEIGSKLR
ncbi:MAG: carbohydrate kinase family protein [Saccharopolyspora sp.]|uniref:carbohydrate kinase family protein n=1 Tax=Saccharopolyspora sp. TaxID=33915 RepID=UPI0025FF238C|nr:carbohydrate kinase family protein [Saccharopolyspora sp.]MBQ6640979.1 carbohydrate kinase family protein [Saccharopolyspora sp.]